MKKWQQNILYIIAILFAVAGSIAGIKEIISKYKGGGESTAAVTPPSREEMMAYLEAISPIAQKVPEAMQEVAPILANPENVADKSSALSQLQMASDKLISYTAQAKNISAPPALSKMHDRFVESISKHAEAFQIAERGVENDDAATIREGTDLLEKGAKELNEVSQEIVQMAP